MYPMSHHPLSFLPSPISNPLKIRRNISLIRHHRLAIHDLLVRVRRPGNQLLPKVHNCPGSKPIALAKLPAPARADRVSAAGDAVGRGAARRIACHGVLAVGDGGDLGVDAELDHARGVRGIAGAGEGLDDPRLDVGAGGDGVSGGGGGDGGQKAEEDGGVLHFCGWGFDKSLFVDLEVLIVECVVCERCCLMV